MGLHENCQSAIEGGGDIFVHIFTIERDGLMGSADRRRICFKLSENCDRRSMTKGLQSGYLLLRPLTDEVNDWTPKLGFPLVEEVHTSLANTKG